MSGKISIFKRYEKKYMINKEQYNSIIEKIAEFTKPDKYDQYTICNIYYDTDNYELIRRSIEKPIYKEKLRARSYGTPNKQGEIFFELKKKYKKEVFKRRVSMKVNEFEQYLDSGKAPNVSNQVLGEIEYFMSLYKPTPKAYIAYERIAFVGNDDPDLRITFDYNIRFRADELNLCKGDEGIRVLDESTYLLEIKVRGAMPMWLSKILNETQVYPVSFSKYGFCYENYILNKNNLNTNKQITA